ncbi:hypothetical protein B7463_g2677, partial [Scytalidium lignicola]
MPISAGTSSLTFALTTSLQQPPLTITAGGTTTVLPLPEGTLAGNEPLPTTVYSSNGLTQTFSEAQLTLYATIAGQTTITTSIVESRSSTSSTTVIPLWLQAGGFYWSPVPQPTSPPIVVPDVPAFPPVPSPACFKLFGIFSIDCPPNNHKGAPTTTFRRGTPSPTCTAHCGTLSQSSEQNSQTTTRCSSTTVTDYFVSCSMSSCTTTSSKVVSGCQVTATTTTVGDYCPAGVAVNSNDDQGDDVPVTPSVVTTITVPESVGVDGSIYTVSSGEIVVGGTTLTIPAIATTAIETIGGHPISTTTTRSPPPPPPPSPPPSPPAGSPPPPPPPSTPAGGSPPPSPPANGAAPPPPPSVAGSPPSAPPASSPPPPPALPPAVPPPPGASAPASTVDPPSNSAVPALPDESPSAVASVELGATSLTVVSADPVGTEATGGADGTPPAVPPPVPVSTVPVVSVISDGSSSFETTIGSSTVLKPAPTFAANGAAISSAGSVPAPAPASTGSGGGSGTGSGPGESGSPPLLNGASKMIFSFSVTALILGISAYVVLV